MDKHSRFDFVTSIALMLLAVVMIFDCYRIWKDVGGALYASPGMLPMFLAVLLLFTSVRLFQRSVRARGVRGNASDFVAWLRAFSASTTAREMLRAGLALALYTFVLAPRLPFWASTSIFMVVVMALVRATTLPRIALITALVVGGVYGVFRMIFHVPLP